MEDLKKRLDTRLRKEWLSYENNLLQNYDKSNFISKSYEIFCIKEIAEYYAEYVELDYKTLEKLLQFDGNLLNHLYEEYMRDDSTNITANLCEGVDIAMNKLSTMKLF